MLKYLMLLALLCSPTLHAEYSRDQPMTIASLNGVEIAYTEAGEVTAPPVLLIMGLTASHELWDEDYVNGIVDAGYRVLLFDNRDTGQSARLDDLGEPIWWWELLKDRLGFDVDPVYTLDDMAADAVALLSHLHIDQAHIVGVSMGGMIAQQVAANYPQRVQSLTSIMSSTGAPHLPPPSDEAQQGLMSIGDADDDADDEAKDGPGGGLPTGRQLRDLGLYPEAMPRQLLAIVAAGDRSAQVQTISVPTLVQHGELDALLPAAHGAHTAELIADAQHRVYAGMGHNMPAEVIPQLLADMLAHFDMVEQVAR